MSNYTKSTDFASKDTLPSGDSAKIVRGTEIDAEFEAIETAVNSKVNTSDIGTTVQAYDADLTTLGAGGASARSFLGLVIGTNVQAWDADLDTWAGKTAPSGTVVGTTDTQTLTNKTLTTPVISGNANMTGGTKYQVDGVTTNALAWGNFDGTASGTITPRSNYNCSSVTKNATGDYTLNFTSALSDANYAAIACAGAQSNTTLTNTIVTISVVSTTAARITVFNTSNTGIDRSGVQFAIFGN